MRLLLATQTIDQNDPVLGFFHRWIEEFARHCEHVYVICLREGTHSLPQNVTILSLGKDQRKIQGEKNAEGIFLARLRYFYRFFLYIWKYRNEYDSVFVHMNQIYVILGAIFWRLCGKRVGLWYAHGAVSPGLRLAELGAHTIITSTPEGFRLPSVKVHVVGQGIDTDRFQCAKSPEDQYDLQHIRIVYVGRISPVKQCEVLIEAAGLLRDRGEKVLVTFVGETSAPATAAYYASLLEQVHRLGLEDCVMFVGGVSHSKVAPYLCAADVFVNPSVTGSLDKAGLEAIAAGVPVITCNEAFAEVLGKYVDRLMFPKGDSRALADRMVALHRSPDRTEIIETLRATVLKEHSLEGLIPRILSVLREDAVHENTHKKILVTTGLYPPEIGGPATYTKMLEAELSKYGYEVSVLPFSTVRHLPKVLRHFAYFLKCLSLGRGVDIIFAQDPVSVGLPTMLAAKLLGKDFLLRLGGDYAWEQGRQGRYYLVVRLFKWVQTRVALAASGVAVQSEFMKRIVVCWGIPEEKITVIPNGFDGAGVTEDRQTARDALALLGTIGVSAARLVPWKGFAGLIEIVPEIIKRIPDFVLHILGDGPGGEKFHKMVLERGLEEKVIFAGRLEKKELMRYLAAADVFILNTEYEGFSNQLLEVMASATPIVTTDIEGNQGLITDRISGLLVPLHDSEALKSAILQVLENKTLASKLVNGGKEKLQGFSVGRVMAATADFLS